MALYSYGLDIGVRFEARQVYGYGPTQLWPYAVMALYSHGPL